MPSGHTNKSAINKRPLTNGMRGLLDRLVTGPVNYQDLTPGEQNQARALSDRGLVSYELRGLVQLALTPAHHALLAELTPTGDAGLFLEGRLREVSDLKQHGLAEYIGAGRWCRRGQGDRT